MHSSDHFSCLRGQAMINVCFLGFRAWGIGISKRARLKTQVGSHTLRIHEDCKWAIGPVERACAYWVQSLLNRSFSNIDYPLPYESYARFSHPDPSEQPQVGLICLEVKQVCFYDKTPSMEAFSSPNIDPVILIESL